jgi:hypothetical protein
MGVMRGDVASDVSNGDIAKIRDEGDMEVFAVGEKLCGVTTPVDDGGLALEGEGGVLIFS